MNKKRLIITSLISLILVSILFVGTTYSIFVSNEVDPNSNVYTTGNLDITYTLSSDNVKFTNATPISDDKIENIKPYRITVNNMGNVDYKFNVILIDTTATESINYDYIMTEVGKLDPISLSSTTSNIIKSDIIIKAGTSVPIDVRLFLSDDIPNTEIGKNFSAKLSIDGIAVNYDKGEVDNSDLIAYYPIAIDVITSEAVMDNISSTYVSSDSGIDFANSSSNTNGKGVYMLSSTKDDLYPIYYYRGAVKNNNVLFADMCWKIVRTTETGGTKLIYNGTPREAVNNINSITQDKYTNVTNDSTNPYTYDTDTNKWTSSNHTNSATGTIEFSVSDAGEYYLEYSVSSEEGYDYAIFYLDDVEKTRVSGIDSGIVDLGNINNSNVIKVEYVKDEDEFFGDDNVVFSVGTSTGELSMTCDNNGESSQIGTSAFNSNGNNPAYVGYMYGDTYTYSTKSMSSVTDTYYYGSDVTYSGGTYTLTNTISSNSWSSIYNGGLNNNHYTCLSTGTTCSSVYYIYYTSSSTAYYITLTNGKKVEDALGEMLSSSSNSTSSTIKEMIDTWYSNNLTSYTDKLEDTIWCNDRSIGELNGWNPNGGSTTSYLRFSALSRNYSNRTPSLTCTNAVDKFTVDGLNGNGKLIYPVGLLTADEMALAGASYGINNSSYYLYTGQFYWSMSSFNFSSNFSVSFGLHSTGSLYNSGVNNAGGVRPSISLKNGTSFASGTGTVTNPYVVE